MRTGNILKVTPRRICSLAVLANLLAGPVLSTGCASHSRLATTAERESMQATLQVYAKESRLTGDVTLNKTVRVKDDSANVGYQLYEPRVELSPLRMHARMVRTTEGWRVVSNKADPTLFDLSAWPMLR